MYKGKRVGVVVPAYNEERFISGVLETMPAFVDRIYAVNDGSTDRTLEIAQAVAREDDRITVIQREQRGGIGAAVTTGHKKALEDGMDVVAVMAGDGEMDPARLQTILDPVVRGEAHYSKGNRFGEAGYSEGMSPWRRLGNSLVLKYLNRIASGYWHVSDPQHGYTAISGSVLARLPLDTLCRGYAFENHMLLHLNVIGARVIDVPIPVRASTRASKKYSKIRYPSFIVRTSWILLKGFAWRVWVKYVKRAHLSPVSRPNGISRESEEVQ